MGSGRVRESNARQVVDNTSFLEALVSRSRVPFAFLGGAIGPSRFIPAVRSLQCQT
jgi:hypothetical protein